MIRCGEGGELPGQFPDLRHGDSEESISFGIFPGPRFEEARELACAVP